MSGHPTPRTVKSAAEHNTREGALKQNQVQGWRLELANKINVYKGDINSYLDEFVPTRTACPITPPSDASLASELDPKEGQEVANYGPLMGIFTALQSEFPQEKKLSFYDCHSQPIAFPFAAHAEKHSKAKPDIAVSFPGDVLPETMTSPDWSRFSMVIEAKDTAKEDPFEGRNGLVHVDALVQLAISARSIMFAHGLLATFMIGIYGDVVRIARFDHACAVASPPFALKTAEGLAAIQKFFWHFVHPWEGVVVGADPTLRKLTENDIEWLKLSLGDRAEKRLAGVELSEGRWTKVWDEGNPRDWKAFFLFKLIDVNTRLFSRATMVWLGIEDTRISDPDEDEPKPPLRIIKEAWRQVIRISEDQFYARLKETIDPEDWCGLPKLLHGCDLGVRDVARWDAARAGKKWDGDDDLLEMLSVASDSTSSETSTAPSSLFSATASSSSSCNEVPDVDIPQSNPVTAAIARLPHPMHQTYSWRLSTDPRYQVFERSHMRFVVDTVGLPLSEFRSTKELVMAIRDAIRGHQLMMERGGVLHRDVSSGNILIVEEPQPEDPPSRGFLHDYDYSSMTLEPPGKGTRPVSSKPPPLRPLELADVFEDVAKCKERTGTYYYLALELLDPIVKGKVDHDSPHDVESFFWVLLWIILRHTDHRHEGGKQGCELVFIYGSDAMATMAKQAWLLRSVRLNPVLEIIGNAPLTSLLHSFHVLVYDATIRMADRVPLTYASVLDIFDAAIARDDWPVGDKALPFKLTDNRTKLTVVRTQAQTGDKRPWPALENDGVQSDSSEDDDEVESMLSLFASASAAKRPKMIPPMLGDREQMAEASTSRARGSRGSRGSGKPLRKRGSGQGSKASGSKGKKGSGARDVSGA
ncbi:hypothetical protein TRAPUB_3321 [Trametes pubescens]|uniref:Fungal-type protein kinase domain-containing protein n=1 Tax=Trametes pubescens TaxID=154538 RepID=A0A1M2VE50_TRAPU|nr:hypothetical protein TRAPUB_3321 [Trametes pubescens]